MPYVPPVAEQKFVLRHIAGIDWLGDQPAFATATPDVVDAVIEGAGAFAAGEWAPLSRVGDTVGAQWDDGKVTTAPGYKAGYAAYVEGGWPAVGAPEPYGGQGMPLSIQTAVLEQLGTADFAFSLCVMLSHGAIEALIHHGSDEQKTEWLPKLVSGEWTGTMNLTEPQAGSDVGALRTQATPAGDGQWRIKGQKIFITFGEHDLAPNIVHLVLARTPGAPAGTKGISLFVVPKVRRDGTPNDIRCVSIEHKMGLHGSPTCVLAYGDNDDCLGELLGPEHGGMRAMFTMMNNARLNVGLQGVQIAERATQAAVGYALDRVQSARAGSASRESVAIVEHPDVRRMLLRMKALTQAIRALTYYAAGLLDRAKLGDAEAGMRADLLIPLVKAYGTDVGVEVASIGVQVHGGMGLIEETGAAQHYRDARITPIYEGTNGIQAADLVGRKLAMDNGGVLDRLIADVRSEAALGPLADAVDDVARWMRTADTDDRLGGSYPFLTMLSVLVSGWLMARAGAVVEDADVDPAFRAVKQAAVHFYLTRIVPEAIGLKAGAIAGADGFYTLDAEAFRA